MGGAQIRRVGIAIALVLIFCWAAYADQYTLPRPKHPEGKTAFDCGTNRPLEDWKLDQERAIADAERDLARDVKARDAKQKEYNDAKKIYGLDPTDANRKAVDTLGGELATLVAKVAQDEEKLKSLRDELDRGVRDYNDNCHPGGGGCRYEGCLCSYVCPGEAATNKCPPPLPGATGGGQCR